MKIAKAGLMLLLVAAVLIVLLGLAWGFVVAPFELEEWSDRKEIRGLLERVEGARVVRISGGYDVGVTAVVAVGDTEIEFLGLVPESFNGERAVHVGRIGRKEVVASTCFEGRESWSRGLDVGQRSNVPIAQGLTIHTVGDLVMHHSQVEELIRALPRCASKSLQNGETHYCSSDDGDLVATEALRCAVPAYE